MNSDGLNELGKYVRDSGERADHALNRFSKNQLKVEKQRDIFDKVVPFEMEFMVGENEKTVDLDLMFRRPPPSGCCGNCICARCEIFTDGVNEIVLEREYIPNTLKVFLNGELTTAYTETNPAEGLVTFNGSFDTEEELKICYLYENGNDCTQDDGTQEICIATNIELLGFYNSSTTTSSDTGPWTSANDEIWPIGDWQNDAPMYPIGNSSDSRTISVSPNIGSRYGEITIVGPESFGVKKPYTPDAPWNQPIVTGRFKFSFRTAIPSHTEHAVQFTYGAAKLKLTYSSTGGEVRLITGSGEVSTFKNDWVEDTDYIAEIKLNLDTNLARGNIYVAGSDTPTDTVSRALNNETIGNSTYFPIMGMYLYNLGTSPFTVRLSEINTLTFPTSETASMLDFNRIVSSYAGWGGGWVTYPYTKNPGETPSVLWSADGANGVMEVTDGSFNGGEIFYDLPDGPVYVRFSLSDYNDIVAEDGINMWFKKIPAVTSGYTIRERVSFSTSSIQTTHGDTSISVQALTNIFTSGDPINVAIYLSTSSLSVKVWEAGTAEPLDWTVSNTQNTATLQNIGWSIEGGFLVGETFKIGPVIGENGLEAGIPVVAPGAGLSGLYGQRKANLVEHGWAPSGLNGRHHGWGFGPGGMGGTYPGHVHPNGYTYPVSYDGPQYTAGSQGAVLDVAAAFPSFSTDNVPVLRDVDQRITSREINPAALRYLGDMNYSNYAIRMIGSLSFGIGGDGEFGVADPFIAMRGFKYGDATLNGAGDVFFFEYSGLGIVIRYWQPAVNNSTNGASIPIDEILTFENAMSIGTNGVNYLQYSIEVEDPIGIWLGWGFVPASFLFPSLVGFSAAVNVTELELIWAPFGIGLPQFSDDPCPPNQLIEGGDEEEPPAETPP